MKKSSAKRRLFFFFFFQFFNSIAKKENCNVLGMPQKVGWKKMDECHPNDKKQKGFFFFLSLYFYFVFSFNSKSPFVMWRWSCDHGICGYVSVRKQYSLWVSGFPTLNFITIHNTQVSYKFAILKEWKVVYTIRLISYITHNTTGKIFCFTHRKASSHCVCRIPSGHRWLWLSKMLCPL